MDLQLHGKRALVTGSSSGIGEGIAKNLAQEGVVVAVHGRDEEQANRVAQEIAASGGKAFVAVGNLSTDEGARQVTDKALVSLGGVDILVNAAGKFESQGWTETPTTAWAETYNTNVLTMVRLIGLILPQMKQLGWGRLINIASAAAMQPFAYGPDYAGSKAAVVNMTVSLAKALAETGITVNTVSPGPIVTAVVERYYRQSAASRGWGTEWAEIEKHAVQEDWPNPTGRLGRVEDVANLVAYLASPLAGYVNGANYRVDGGGVGTVN